MEDNQQKIDQLLKKLEILQGVHSHFAEEIAELREEINQLKNAPLAPAPVQETPQAATEVKQETAAVSTTAVSSRLVRVQDHKIVGGVCAGMAQKYGMNLALMRFLWVLFALLFCVGALVYVILWATLPIGEGFYETSAPEVSVPVMQTTSTPQATAPKKPAVDLEKYIGENLISKIGIAVLVIGVGIGAKYSIDNDLISPVVRIILGYTIGAALLVLSQKLKQKYENFSAVLVSGAMAIFYFMTFAAYSFYDMISPVTAFVLMALVTVAAVGAALNYNKQFIAHIGLVGAYCIPFLLSEGKGQVLVLFSYMTIINVGILVVAFKKYWKPLNLVAFFVTWLVVLSWYKTSYVAPEHFSILLGFGFVFFVIFYLTFLGYKLIKKEPFEALDIVLVLANSFVFYGLGYSLLKDMPEWEAYLGLYTLFHALLHGVVGVVIYQQKGIDKPIFYLVSGMFLVFITLAIPVQLDGRWVTLLWLGEGAVLYWIGKTQHVSVYEKIAYPVLVLAFISLLQDWNLGYYGELFSEGAERFYSLVNPTFFTSFLFCSVLGYLNYLHYNKKYPAAFPEDKNAASIVSVSLSGMLLLVLYFTFALEISYYWEGLFQDSAMEITPGSYGKEYNNDFLTFKTLWGILYFTGYTTLLMLVNDRKIKSKILGILSLCLGALGLAIFLTVGLYELSELRDSYLAEGFAGSWFYLGIRYLAYAFVAALLMATSRHLKFHYKKVQYAIPFDLILATTIWWTASSELIHWLDLSGAQDSYKLGLTIFWGVYALGLSAFGIWKGKKHLRVAAIALFGTTLLKLFIYDLADLSTLSKTVVFVSLGILLLLISFLYNKFKEMIEE